MPNCIAYNEDGRICGEFATTVDPQRGGLVCGKHNDFTAEWVQEIDRLRGIDQQRGTDEMIKDAADTIVKLRRAVASVQTQRRLIP